MALSLPCDTAGRWIPSQGILVSFIRKADARAAVTAMAVRGAGGGGGGGGGEKGGNAAAAAASAAVARVAAAEALLSCHS